MNERQRRSARSELFSSHRKECTLVFGRSRVDEGEPEVRSEHTSDAADVGGSESGRLFTHSVSLSLAHLCMSSPRI